MAPRRSSSATAAAALARGVTPLALALLHLGCATVESGAHKVDAATTERAFEQVKHRAAWDFRCPQGAIRVVVLNVASGVWNDNPAQIGAVGCGHRAAYVDTSSGWVANTTSVELRR